MDTDHSGNCKFSEIEDDPAAAKYRTGYVMKYTKCPIVWHSKLQGEIALSATEAEFISLSESTRDVTPLTSSMRPISGMTSLVYSLRLMNSASVADKAIYPCNLECQTIGHLAYVIT